MPGNWRGVQMVRQTSKSACVEGRSWGYDRGGVWVNDGCAGVFAAGNGRGGYRGRGVTDNDPGDAPGRGRGWR